MNTVIEVEGIQVTIEADFSDKLFKNNLIKLVKTLRDGAKVMEDKIKEVENNKEIDEFDRMVQLSDIELNYCSDIKTRVKTLIGETACEYLYGTGVPSVERYIPLIKKLTDITVEENTKEKERLEEIFNSYTRGIEN